MFSHRIIRDRIFRRPATTNASRTAHPIAQLDGDRLFADGPLYVRTLPVGHIAGLLHEPLKFPSRDWVDRHRKRTLDYNLVNGLVKQATNSGNAPHLEATPTVDGYHQRALAPGLKFIGERGPMAWRFFPIRKRTQEQANRQHWPRNDLRPCLDLSSCLQGLRKIDRPNYEDNRNTLRTLIEKLNAQ